MPATGRHAAIATGKSAVAGKKTGNVNATATRTKPSTRGNLYRCGTRRFQRLGLIPAGLYPVRHVQPLTIPAHAERGRDLFHQVNAVFRGVAVTVPVIPFKL